MKPKTTTTLSALSVNPYVRPRRRPAGPALPRVWDLTSLPGPRICELTHVGETYSWDNPAAWTLEYACLWHVRIRGRRVRSTGRRVRTLLARSRADAIRKLQHERAGFGIAALVLLRVQAPPDATEIAAIRAANRQIVNRK